MDEAVAIVGVESVGVVLNMRVRDASIKSVHKSAQAKCKANAIHKMGPALAWKGTRVRRVN
jgi:hypothetical protein